MDRSPGTQYIVVAAEGSLLLTFNKSFLLFYTQKILASNVFSYLLNKQKFLKIETLNSVHTDQSQTCLFVILKQRHI